MNLKTGQTWSMERVFTQRQFDRFAILSGDDNPIHVDPEFSARTKFGQTVAHGMFLYANLVRALGEIAPGAIQREQELMFPAPTYTGEIVRLDLAVTEVSDQMARLSTDVVKFDGTIGCQGSTLLVAGGLDGLPATAPPGPPPGSEGWKGFAVGQSAALTRAYSRADMDEYIDLLREANPLYSDPAFGRAIGLRGAPLPGPLLGAMFSCLLGTELPGRGTNWLKQRFLFLRAAYPSDELVARVRITRIRPEKELVNLRTWITGPDGGLICDGEALVWVNDVELGSTN
jgi:acyl dehydratase